MGRIVEALAALLSHAVGGNAHNFRNGQIAMMSHLATPHPLSGELWVRACEGLVVNSSPQVQAVLLPTMAAATVEPRCLPLLRHRLSTLIARVWPELSEPSQTLLLNAMPPAR